MSKRKVKQEVGLVLLFEMFLIGNVKQTNQINIYNLTSIVIGQKSTNQIGQYMVESWHGFACCYQHRKHSEGLWMIFQRVFRHC